MARRTLKQIINAAQQEFALPQSDTIFGNDRDATASQMLGFLQSGIEELFQANDKGWTILTRQYNLVVRPPIILTGTITDASPIITVPDTTGIEADLFSVSGNGIPQGARVVSVDSPTQVTMNMIATGDNANATIIFAKDTYPEPSDFSHFISDTWWDRTNRWRLLGPSSPQEDQWHLSGIVATGPRRFFRQIGGPQNNYRLWPPPAEIVNPIQLVFEYISNAPILESASPNAERLQYWNSDLNVPLLDDRALILDIKWRFWAQKGLNWLALRKDRDDYVSRLIARDGGNTKLNLVPHAQSIYITPQNVQDGFYPGPGGPGNIT